MREKKIEQYDVVIIGGGPSGLTAAIYCGRAHLNTLLIEKSLIGGLATYTNEIENFPGFPDVTTGLGMMELFHKQAKKFGVKFKLTDVKNVELEGETKRVETFRNIFEAKAVIIASGGRQNPTTGTRVFWGILEGVLAAALLIAGGLKGLQTASITIGLPFCLLVILMCLSLLHGLRRDELVDDATPT